MKFVQVKDKEIGRDDKAEIQVLKSDVAKELKVSILHKG